MTFTQFQVHSSYSLLNSPQTLPGIIQAAKTRGYSRVALTDTNVVSGLVDFYTQAKQADIMPILGMTMQLADENVPIDSRDDGRLSSIIAAVITGDAASRCDV